MAVNIETASDASGNSLIELFDLQDIESQRIAGQSPRLTPQAQVVQRTDLTHPNIQMGNTTDAPSEENRDTDLSGPNADTGDTTRVFEIRIAPETVSEIQASGTSAFVPVRLDSIITAGRGGGERAENAARSDGAFSQSGSVGPDGSGAGDAGSAGDVAAEFFLLVTPETVAEVVATVAVEAALPEIEPDATEDDDDAPDDDGLILIVAPPDLDASAASLEVEAATGIEDTAIALDIAAALTDIDGSETLSIEIDGLPDGATLSAGIVNADGSAILTPADLEGLTITPPANSDADFSLQITATTTEGASGATATTAATLPVTVTAAADAPSLSAEDASGAEDTAIALEIASTQSDTDGSETLSITVGGLPEGASLSAGTVNPDGSVTLTPAQLEGLTITPPANSDADFSLQVTATTTEVASGATATTTATLPITVTAAADAPSLTAEDASGAEDTAIALEIASTLSDTDGSETLSITVGGLPEGASLSAGTVNPDGSVTLTPAQLEGLTITPPANSDADFSLQVTATTTEVASGATATTTATLPITVTAAADAPSLAAEGASGAEDTAIALEIASTLSDTDGSETLSITVGGLPEGASLSAGTVNPDGSVTLTPEQLEGLTLTPSANSDANFSLQVTATTTEVASGATATTTATLPITVTAAADAPSLAAEGASGAEDTAIALDIASTLIDTDGSETLSIEIDGLPDGATLSAGIVNPDGSAILTPADLEGLTITPPANSDADFSLQVTATTTEGASGATATTTATLPVTVTAAADTPSLTAEDASGAEDTAIALDIASTLNDTDGSETLSITLDGLPEGAVLSAGTVNPDGSVTLTPAALEGLTITPPANSDADFSLQVTATTTEGASGANATTTATLPVTVTAAADTPSLSAQPASGDEDTAISLDISSALSDTDGSETLSIVVLNVPDGATLSAGTVNPDGSITLTPAELEGLTVTPPADFHGSFDLQIRATASESANADSATTRTMLQVSVSPVADGVVLTGTPGRDQLTGGGGGDQISGLANNDNLQGRDGDDRIDGGDGKDRLDGDAGNDHLEGGGGNDQLFGGDVADTLIGGAGRDTLDGGDGNDTFVLNRNDEAKDVLRGGDGTDTVVSDNDGDFQFRSFSRNASIEVIDGGTSPSDIEGTSSGNTLDFRDTELRNIDEIDGGRGNDRIFGSAGDDRIDGGDGNDKLFGEAGADDLEGGKGNDQLFGGDGADRLSGGAGRDVLDGGAGDDTFELNRNDDSKDVLRGGDGTDTIVSDNDGDFQFENFRQNSSIEIIDGGTTASDIEGTSGKNTLDFRNTELRNIDEIDAGRGNDQVFGSQGDDRIDGGDGDDRLFGDAGADSLDGGKGNDKLFGGDGADALEGGDGNDRLSGDAGADNLDGGKGDDRLIGGAGEDTLTGGAGRDILDGGADNDLFIFGAGQGNDVVHGRNGWLDTIRLEDGNGGSPNENSWELELGRGSVEEQMDDYLALSNDASGTITFDDGSQVVFDGVERIEW